MMGNGMGFGVFWMVLLLIALVALAVWLVRASSRGTGTSRAKDAERESAVEVAERRYAKGEISREEFESIKRDVS